MSPTTQVWRAARTPPLPMARFLLLHSPLVGPLTLSPLAEALERLGHSAAAPDLRSAVSASGLSIPILRALVVQSIADLHQHDPLILAAHSGAGLYLPILAPGLALVGQVLIDAVVPPDAGSFTPSADFRAKLDRLVEADGHLPRWPQWWSEDVMAELVPDPEFRAAMSRECPRLPISFYDRVIDVPASWAQPWAGYLRLSEAYEPQASTAAERGWPVSRRHGGHLDTATRPHEVARDLIDLVQPFLQSRIRPLQ